MNSSRLAVQIAAACLLPLGCKSAFAEPITPDNLELPATQVSGQAVSETDDRLHLDTPNAVGSRLGLTARETPASIEIKTQAEMQQKGLRTTKEAFADVTGVTVGNVPGNPAVISMRGFTGNTVNVMQDGVRIAASTITTRDMDTWKYEKIEVLKGPASVLYGEGSLGGAVNLVTRKPTLDEQKLEGLVSTGSFGTKRAAIGVNQPLNDSLALRADVSYVNSDSFYDVDDQETTAFNISTSLLFKPNDDLSMLFAFDHDYDEYDSTYNGTPLVPASVARNPSGIVSSKNGLVVDKSIRRTNYNPDGANSGARSTTWRWTTDYRLNDDWTLNNIVSYYTARREFFVSSEQNYNAGSGRFNRTVQRVSHDHQFWNERLSASTDQLIGGFRNRFSVGAEYSYTDLNNPRQNGTTTSVDPWNPVVGSFPSSAAQNWPGAGRNVVYQSNMDNTAVFAEDAFNLTDDWLLIGGLRYEDINLRRTVEDVNLGTSQKFHPTYDPFSWRLGTVYNLTPDIQLYAQYSTAVTPVSTLLLIASANGDFDLSKGRSVEVGFKASLFDGRTSLTGALYQIDLEDILTRDPNDSTLTVQGGKQRSRGVELTSSTQLTTQLRADLGVSVVDARYEELIEAGGADRSDNHPVNVPRTTANAALIYRFEPVPITVGAYVRHSSGFYTDTANTYFVEGYTTFDASIAYEMKNATLTLRGRNLTNRLYGEYSGYSSTQVYLGAPRSAELSLGFKF
ncbi:TonB-dependent siderophore receptor [Pseudomonas capsici]|uniref:TonB-dependent receptor n=1 Tax=Pseudomonas capsici TaxID=2810614 RepID=UPI0021F1A2C7|nr:TonB-dependent siderophore receptor [Pseudomonas capsici]MCV4288996.1 TonB-dependent siderophore receptor [Pseudomonas capsici]